MVSLECRHLRRLLSVLLAHMFTSACNTDMRFADLWQPDCFLCMKREEDERLRPFMMQQLERLHFSSFITAL